MSEPVTLEDIYQLFRASQADLEASKAESEREIREIRQILAEMARSSAEAKIESDRRQAEAERHQAEAERYQAEADRRQAEVERRAAEAKIEADRSMAQLERTVERTSRAVDSLTTRWGRFVEELVEPAVIRLFQQKGIDVKEVYPRARVRRQGIAMEIDILAVDENALVLVECKSRLSKDDVDEFLEKLSRFKVAFPNYKNFQAYGAVAGIEINEGIDRYAYKKGLFVIKPSGDTVEIINDTNFQPMTW